MTEKTLVLEGLPDDLDRIISKLDLYFRNIRRSGGEVSKIQNYPGDKRKALLVYVEDAALQKVLSKGNHQIDFKKPFGLIELQVKLMECVETKGKKSVKPPVKPRPDLAKLTLLGKSALNIGKEQPAAEHPTVSFSDPVKDKDINADLLTLLVSSTCEEKDILELYLGQFSSEEKVSLTRHVKSSWILKLSNQSDVEKVLAKKDHQYGISVVVYNEKEVEGKLDPRRFILTGFPESCKCSLVSLFIKSCSQGAEHAWETLDDEDGIVVTFKQDIDIKSFLKKCSTKKFPGMEIGACRLELTDSVLVQWDMREFNEESLDLYFSSKRSRGGCIKSMIWVNMFKRIVITFEDCHVAHNVAEHKHNFGGVDLITQLFYTSLQKALTGQTSHQPAINTHVVLPLSAELLGFISHNEARKKEFTSQLCKVHASVSFNMATDPPQMDMEMNMEKESMGMLQLGPAWERKAKREAMDLLNKYKEVKLDAEVEVWVRIESDCLGLSSSDVSISYKSCNDKIVVVAVLNKVETIVEKIEKMVKKANDELETKRDTIERKFPLDSKEELDFISDLVSGKLVDVEFSKDEESFTICLKGLKDKVKTAEGVIKETQGNVDVKTLDKSVSLMGFLMSLDLKKFEREHFAQNHILSTFLLGDGSLQILAEKDDLQRAEDKLLEVIKEEFIELTTEQAHVTKTEHWKDFFTKLIGDLESSHNSQNVSISLLGAKIGVCGFSSVVADVLSKIKDYLENKKLETVDVPLKSVQEVEFVASCMDLSEDPELKALGGTILPCQTQGSPCLKVTAASDKIKEAVDAVNKRIYTITTAKYVYSKAGESKVLEKNEVAMALKAKAKDLECKLYLLSAPANCQKLSYDIDQFVTLTIGHGNISQHVSDALVCPLSSTAFDNPVAQQFLQSGGPEIKKVIAKFQTERQNLVAGEVVLSNTGTLRAKDLIYAVIPICGRSYIPLNTAVLQAAIKKSLIKADNTQCVSIGMPALGCGTFGFPAKESCAAVIKAILGLNTSTSQHLRNIFVIDSDAKIVEEFQSAVEDMGYHRTTVTNTAPITPPTNSATPNTPPLPVAKPGSDLKVTIGGVYVILKKGDITKEIVDVIVNSNNSNLNLDSGVSGAILKAAGQSVVDECKKLGTQKPDGVVLTGGGNLKCKHIAQMVGPNNSADITASIEKVLQLCESKKAATVSIPTIGTGKGGIEPKHSIQAILTGLENHTSQIASSSIKFIFIVAFEQTVFDSMQDYISKKYSGPQQTKQASPSRSTLSSLPPNQAKINGVLIEVRKGDITLQTGRAIVNTTNADINLNRGVSGAIFRAAGSAIGQECQNIGPLQGNEPAVTSGGALQCDFIIHMLGPHSLADATLRVTKVLQCCEDKRITTVSFPAVGTGGGGLKGTESVGAILQGIKDHLSQKTSTVLKLICMIVDQDTILQEFQQGLNQWKSSQADKDTSFSGSSSEEEEEDDTGSQTANTIEAVIGTVKVKVLCGDITQEKTDAIVSSTTTTLNLSSGVSGAILKAAGKTVVDECTALGTQPSDGVVITKPGNLPTKHIIHMVGQTNEKGITSSMIKVLQMCEDKKIQSVSFPALGTGAGSLGAVQVGNAMLAAIESLVISIQRPSLTDIHIVIFQIKMMKDFEEVLKKYKKVIPRPGFIKSSKHLRTTRPTQPRPAKPTQVTPTKTPLCLASATAAVTFPTMEAVVYGSSAASLDQVKKLLDKLLSEECTSNDLNSSHFPLLLEPEKAAIVALSKKNQVCLLVATPDKVTISGKRDDVLATELQITNYLQKARDRESRKGHEKRLREMVCWETGQGEVWVEVDSSLSYDLEEALQKEQRSYSYNHQGETYTVDLKDMQQTDRKGTITRVKRNILADSNTVVIQLPPSWTVMDSRHLDIVDLVTTSMEYKNIEKEFVQSCKNPASPNNLTITVVKIQRIQSKDQWQRYDVKKQALDKKNPKNKNEINLYHGTTTDICQKINTNGFNRGFCGRNATVHGDGTYFAKEAWYSCHDAYSKPDASGLKYMYRAKVLVGKPCQGRSGMKEPDPLDPSNPSAGLYDSAVDNPNQPFIYVVFCDAGAYPDYLISFKTA